MHPDNETKIPEISEIELKPMASFTVDDITVDHAYTAYEKAVKEKLDAIYGRRIEEKHEDEEWIWVDGYKGTEYDMTAYDNFQYELNRLYSMDEDVKIKTCESGFHLCLSIGDVFEYYGIGEQHRFFKVRALVRKKDYDKYGKFEMVTSLFGKRKERVNKLAAKQILIERELTLEEIFFEDKYAGWTEDEKKLALREGERVVKQNRTAVKLVEAGYSEPFAKYVSRSTAKTERAFAVASQPGLSMDMKVFAIMFDE